MSDSNTIFPDPFQPPPGTVIEVEHHTLTLQHKHQNGKPTLYRWRRNDGVWMSPEFTNVTEAMQFPATKGFKIEVGA